MNYLHNAVYSFMKDHGIKPFELFHIRCNIEKDYELYEKLRSLTVGYFDNLYEFHLLESLKERAKPEDENIIVTNILNGTIIVSPVYAFLPEKGERYYYLESTVPAHPEKVSAVYAEWNNTLSDFARYEIGNCFRSEKEVTSKINFYDDMASVYKQKLVMHKEKAFANVA